MQVSEAQRAVTKYHYAEKVDFLGAVERLLDALMIASGDDEWCGKFPPYTDGVLFEFEESRPDYFVGQGLAIIGLTLKQYFEPISAEFLFDAISMEMTGGTIFFGMANSPKSSYGSPDAKKISQSAWAKANSARPKVEFDWTHTFRLADGEWVFDRGSTSPD